MKCFISQIRNSKNLYCFSVLSLFSGALITLLYHIFSIAKRAFIVSSLIGAPCFIFFWSQRENCLSLLSVLSHSGALETSIVNLY